LKSQVEDPAIQQDLAMLVREISNAEFPDAAKD
jgi:hypothetical protein